MTPRALPMMTVIKLDALHRMKLCYPAELVERRSRGVGLTATWARPVRDRPDLDVWVTPAGKAVILDKDEFAANPMSRDAQRAGARSSPAGYAAVITAGRPYTTQVPPWPATA